MVADVLRESYDFGPWRRRFEGAIAEGMLARRKTYLLKPATYMNESGRSVGAAARFRVTQPGFWMETVIEEASPPYRILERGRGGRLDRIPILTGWELLEAAAQECPLTVRRYFFQVSRALQALGIIPQTLPGSGFPAKTYRNTHAMRNELP